MKLELLMLASALLGSILTLSAAFLLNRFRCLIQKRAETDKQSPSSSGETKAKHVFSILALGIVLILAVVQHMEILALFALIGAGAIVYKRRVRAFVDLGFKLLAHTQSARLGKVEFTISNEDLSEMLENKATWIRIIISQLNSEHISLLLSIYKEGGEHDATRKDILRALRDRGLLYHNAPSLSESNRVWLSELGKEVARSLLDIRGVTESLPPTEK